MCEPTTMFAATVASSMLAAGGQMMAVQQQNQAFKANNKALNDSLAWNYHLSQLRDQQQTAAAAVQKQEYALEAAKARSTATVGAQAGGVGGASVDALLGEYFATEGTAKTRIDTQLGFDRLASFSERKSGQMQGQATITRMQSELPNPTMAFLGAGARVLGDTAGAYYRYTTPDPRTGTRRFG